MTCQQWIVGQVHPMIIIPLMLDSGEEDITGADVSDFSLYFNRLNTRTAGTGLISIMQMNPAQLIYKLSAQDVASMSIGYVEIQQDIPDPDGAIPVIYDKIRFDVWA